jgi:hypothetical protein
VGRINRVDTKFDRIHAYNFFPTVQSEDEIGLKAAAESKINAFIEMLGADARLLTDGDEEYLNRLLKMTEEGALPKQTAKKLVNTIVGERDPLKILSVLRSGIPQEFFKGHISESAAETSGPREVILSEYLI